MQKENNYSVGSGAEITCARLGFESYQILAAGDDQKNAIIWKITKTKPKLVSANRFISIFDFESHFQFLFIRLCPITLQMSVASVSTRKQRRCSQEQRVDQYTYGHSVRFKLMC